MTRTRSLVTGISIFMLVSLNGLFVSAQDAAQPEKRILPKVLEKGAISLEELLWKRQSVRAFSNQVPSWEQIGQMLWAAQGVNRPNEKKRTAPSAGATYPLEMYVTIPDGVYRYLPNEHAVVQTKKGNPWEELSKAGFKPASVYQSPCVFVIGAEFERTSKRFGDEATRYVHLEGGHAAQNLLLQAEALGLSTVPIGVALNRQVCDLLGIPKEQKPIYVIATGLSAKQSGLPGNP